VIQKYTDFSYTELLHVSHDQGTTQASLPTALVEQVGKLQQSSRGYSPQTDHPHNKLQAEKLQLGNSSLSHHAASRKPQHCWVALAALAVPDT